MKTVVLVSICLLVAALGFHEGYSKYGLFEGAVLSIFGLAFAVVILLVRHYPGVCELLEKPVSALWRNRHQQ